MNADQALELTIRPALTLLPDIMRGRRAEAMLLAIGLQESRFKYRRQVGGGPARGFWQFERAGGVVGVMTHPESESLARSITEVLRYDFNSADIHAALEHNDLLAACFARLLLWTDPEPLPGIRSAADQGWHYYLRTWRPGKPHPETWPEFWDMALETPKPYHPT